MVDRGLTIEEDKMTKKRIALYKDLLEGTAKALQILFTPLLVLLVSILAGSIKIIEADLGSFLFFIGVPAGATLLFWFWNYKKNLNNFITKEFTEFYLFLIYVFSSLTIILVYLNKPYWFLFSMLAVIFFGAIFLCSKYIELPNLDISAFGFGVVFLAGKLSVAILLLLALTPLLFWAQIYIKKGQWSSLFLGTIIGLSVGILSWVF